MNPFQLMQLIRGNGNPQQIIRQLMQNSEVANNPLVANAMNMFQRGDMDGLQTMASNLAKERGTTLDEVKNQLGIK